MTIAEKLQAFFGVYKEPLEETILKRTIRFRQDVMTQTLKRLRVEAQLQQRKGV